QRIGLRVETEARVARHPRGEIQRVVRQIRRLDPDLVDTVRARDAVHALHLVLGVPEDEILPDEPRRRAAELASLADERIEVLEHAIQASTDAVLLVRLLRETVDRDR